MRLFQFSTAGSRLELAKSGATHARHALIANGHLVERDGTVRIVDPSTASFAGGAGQSPQRRQPGAGWTAR